IEKTPPGCMCVMKGVRVLRAEKDATPEHPWVEPVIRYRADAKGDSLTLQLNPMVITVGAKGTGQQEIVLKGKVELSITKGTKADRDAWWDAQKAAFDAQQKGDKAGADAKWKEVDALLAKIS